MKKRIWSNRVWRIWCLNIWLEITVQCSTMDFWKLLFKTEFRKWFFGTLVLDIFFQYHPDSVILQKYSRCQTRAFNTTQSFFWRLSFEPWFRMFIINVYYATKQTLVVLWLLGFFKLFQQWKKETLSFFIATNNVPESEQEQV